ncbi:hypothetical protein JTE90_020586 [Oedothorax gibbosus]|uniref:Uncharacterized protein n=1 Tax=Oedothorax gibbosus TaxID=931172 RepID=A0AAV6VWJ8_9ARAC|nr:hypothetical protein JTE90_020586 [Oedothorax gibbosus]
MYNVILLLRLSHYMIPSPGIEPRTSFPGKGFWGGFYEGHSKKGNGNPLRQWMLHSSLVIRVALNHVKG